MTDAPATTRKALAGGIAGAALVRDDVVVQEGRGMDELDHGGQQRLGGREEAGVVADLAEVDLSDVDEYPARAGTLRPTGRRNTPCRTG